MKPVDSGSSDKIISFFKVECSLGNLDIFTNHSFKDYVDAHGHKLFLDCIHVCSRSHRRVLGPCA